MENPLSNLIEKEVGFIVSNSRDVIIEAVRRNFINEYARENCRCNRCLLRRTIDYKRQQLDDIFWSVSLLLEHSTEDLGIDKVDRRKRQLDALDIDKEDLLISIEQLEIEVTKSENCKSYT